MVDPDDCRVEPRSLDAFLSPCATPSSTLFDPRNVLEQLPILLPAGGPSVDRVVQRIKAALRELASCQAPGDERCLLALYSDDWLRRSFHLDQHSLQETYRERTEGRGVPGNRCDYPSCSWVMALEPSAILDLDDGRVGVVIDGPPPPDMPVAAGEIVRQFLVFVEVGWRYLIIDVLWMDIDGVATPVTQDAES